MVLEDIIVCSYDIVFIIPLLLVYKYPKLDFVKVFSMGMLCYRQLLFNSPIHTIILTIVYMLYKLDVLNYKTKEDMMKNIVNNSKIKIGLDLIEIYTEYEMYINVLIKDVNEYYMKINNKTNDFKIENKIRVIKNGKEIYKKEVDDVTTMTQDEKDEMCNIFIDINENIEYDFVIYEFLYNKEKCNIVREELLPIVLKILR